MLVCFIWLAKLWLVNLHFLRHFFLFLESVFLAVLLVGFIWSASLRLVNTNCKIYISKKGESKMLLVARRRTQGFLRFQERWKWGFMFRQHGQGRSMSTDVSFFFVRSFKLFSLANVSLQDLHIKRKVEVRFYVPAAWPKEVVPCQLLLFVCSLKLFSVANFLLQNFHSKERCRWDVLCFDAQGCIFMCQLRLLSKGESHVSLIARFTLTRKGEEDVLCSMAKVVGSFALLGEFVKYVILNFPSLQDLQGGKERWKWDVLCSGSMAKAVQLLPLSCTE